jgi:hypothetical protein
MKPRVYAALVASVMAVPAAVSAQQSDAGLTRAQVRAELVQLEEAGYNPAQGEDPNYPTDIQAAEARVAAQNAHNATAQTQAPDTSGVGGVVSGTSRSDRPAATAGVKSIYFGRR